ncbi:MAG: hypothetical protein QM757_26975 [Paludibaculum sp.]
MKKVALLWTLSAAAASGWHDLPALPQSLGGQAVGVSHGALLVMGGSRFDRPPYDGGTKEWADSIHVLAPGAAVWRTFPMGAPRAYTCAVSYGDAVYLAGGANAEGPVASVLRVEWLAQRAKVSIVAPLPHALSQHGCGLIGSRLFVVGGLTSASATSASASLFILDLADPREGWKELEPLPAPGRILAACGVMGSSFYMFGGAELRAGSDGQPLRRYLRDGWRYTPGKGWTAAAPLPKPVVAAPALPISNSILAVFGGDDGALDGRAAELRERHPGFSRTTFLYDSLRDTWTEGPSLPVGLVTTGAVDWQSRIVIPGGEDRPGHRSARVLSIDAWTR